MKIAYIDVGADYTGSDVWVMDADGGNPQQLTDDPVTDDPGIDSELVWFEDGSSIYYNVLGRSKLFVVALDGNGSSPVEWREAAFIVRRFRDHRYLSPDGTKRALVGVLRGDEEDQALFIMTSEDTLMTSEDRVTAIPLSGQPNVDLFFRDLGDSWATTGFPLTWAPNSMRIAFSSITDLIWAVDIDGSNLVELTNGLGGYSPVWQPVSPSATATSVEAQSWGRIKSLLSTGAR